MSQRVGAKRRPMTGSATSGAALSLWSGIDANFLPGGSYFFTVTLADRSSDALVRHIDALRDAFRVTRRERPFAIEPLWSSPIICTQF
jgi:hypothetical protein